jgi:hypothetical protein
MTLSEIREHIEAGNHATKLYRGDLLKLIERIENAESIIDMAMNGHYIREQVCGHFQKYRE